MRNKKNHCTSVLANKLKKVLKKWYSWRAGSGNSSFWYSNWRNLGILGTQVPFVDIHDLQLTLKDVITNNGLHTQALYTILPTALADIINNTQLSFNPSIVDAFVWPQIKNGIYTSKSGYNWLLSLHEAENHSSVSWNWIWRLKVPEKNKVLSLAGLSWCYSHFSVA